MRLNVHDHSTDFISRMLKHGFRLIADTVVSKGVSELSPVPVEVNRVEAREVGFPAGWQHMTTILELGPEEFLGVLGLKPETVIFFMGTNFFNIGTRQEGFYPSMFSERNKWQLYPRKITGKGEEKIIWISKHNQY